MGIMLRKRRVYFYSFIMSCLLFLLTLFAGRMVPFGDNSLLVIDAKDQYQSFYMYLKSILSSSDDIFYSFSSVLGGNVFVLGAYYFFSPWYMLFYFIPADSFLLGIHFVTMMKFAMCGITFCYYLDKRFPEGSMAGKLIFSVCYAFMGYNIAFFSLLSWLDGVALLPLVLLGLQRLMEEGRIGVYSFCLALSLMTNYYIGYMICVISVVAYFFSILINGNWRDGIRKTFLKYCLSSVLAGLLAAIVLIPVALSLPRGRMNTDLENLLQFGSNFHFLDLFSKFFSGTIDYEQITRGLPNVFIGVILFILVILFFINSEIPRRIKVLVFSVIALFILSFHNSTMNVVWHGFSNNVWFNYRYSFGLDFVLLVVAFYSFERVKFLEEGQILKAGLGILVGAIIVLHKDYEYIQPITIYTDLFVGASGIIWLCLDNEKKRQRKYQLMLIILMMGNLFFNAGQTFRNLQGTNQAEFNEIYKNTHEVISEIEAMDDGI